MEEKLKELLFEYAPDISTFNLGLSLASLFTGIAFKSQEAYFGGAMD